MTEQVRQAEAARQLGVSRQAVHDLVARGKLPLINGKVDMSIARLVLAEHLDPARSKIQTTLVAGASPPPPAPPEPSAPDAAQDTPQKLSFQAARTLREHYAALDAKLRYHQLCGELVVADEVRRSAAATAANLRLALETIPDKLAPRLAGLSDENECRALLEAAIDDALQSVINLHEAA